MSPIGPVYSKKMSSIYPETCADSTDMYVCERLYTIQHTSNMKFNGTAGSDVRLSSDRRTATGNGQRNGKNIVFSSEPLSAGEKVTLCIDEGEGYFGVGVTACNPAIYKDQYLSALPATWVLDTYGELCHGRRESRSMCPWWLVSPGDKVDLSWSLSKLTVYQNGKQLCCCDVNINGPVWMAVWILEVKQLSIMETGEPSSKKQSLESPVCEYWQICQRYMKSLGIAVAYLDSEFDRCFCDSCMSSRKDDPYYLRGVPPKDYAIPVGWAKFGLALIPRAKKLKVFELWHVAFHGTRADCLESILDCGDLLMAGDIAIGGKELKPPDGHFTEEKKPKGFDIKQVFVSPTIRYAGREVYAAPSSWTDHHTGESYNAKVALMLRIKPESYDVGPETVLRPDEKNVKIDPKFTNSQLEWSTKERGSTIPVGLVINVEPVKSASSSQVCNLM